MNKKSTKIIALLIILLCLTSTFWFSQNKAEVRTVKSDKELYRLYNGKNSDIKEILVNIFTMPFSILNFNSYSSTKSFDDISIDMYTDSMDIITFDEKTTSVKESSSSSSKDYSTTNIQVENVDEADITKTDGDYIYSISENKVIITNVMDPTNIQITAKIEPNDESLPEDLILYKDKLVVISSKDDVDSYYNNTSVSIYNISDINTPILEKNYELYEPYYTSRCINNTLYVISSGRLRTNGNNIVRTYKENSSEQKIAFENIKYLKNVKTEYQTLISTVNLNDPNSDIDVQSYLIDISNAYVSENAIYLLNQKYSHDNDVMPLKNLFGLKGVIGAFTYEEDDTDSSYYKTEIYKFDINQNGKVDFSAKGEVDGKTINQYSMDEKDDHLRLALYDNLGSRVAILDNKLNQIGTSDYVAKGETMYSSRFIGDKVYFVTFKTIDPLFVVDLSNETKPEILGQLKIPGYSTYLHPYDENHLIGIGMQTEEVVNKNSSGRVISTSTKITGMKMALFDVSDVSHPIQIAETTIGDKRTTSAILTNPKALLFSKERNLIAIPVNNYAEDFEITNSSDTYSSLVNAYTNYDKKYVAEGYFVYNINLNEGFNLKGVITHEAPKTTSNYYNKYSSKLLRGLYIDNNLYTVSENAVKVNNLDTLELINELKIKED